jgi:hypothetical protein
MKILKTFESFNESTDNLKNEWWDKNYQKLMDLDSI